MHEPQAGDPRTLGLGVLATRLNRMTSSDTVGQGACAAGRSALPRGSGLTAGFAWPIAA